MLKKVEKNEKKRVFILTKISFSKVSLFFQCIVSQKNILCKIKVIVYHSNQSPTPCSWSYVITSYLSPSQTFYYINLADCSPRSRISSLFTM